MILLMIYVHEPKIKLLRSKFECRIFSAQATAGIRIAYSIDQVWSVCEAGYCRLWTEPLPRVFDMLQNFETILPLVESL